MESCSQWIFSAVLGLRWSDIKVDGYTFQITDFITHRSVYKRTGLQVQRSVWRNETWNTRNILKQAAFREFSTINVKPRIIPKADRYKFEITDFITQRNILQEKGVINEKFKGHYGDMKREILALYWTKWNL